MEKVHSVCCLLLKIPTMLWYLVIQLLKLTLFVFRIRKHWNFKPFSWCVRPSIVFNMFSLLMSGCIWLGVNHKGKGIFPVGQRSRSILQIGSLVVQAVFWVVAITGIVVVGRDSLENVEKLKQELNELEKEKFVHNLSPNFSEHDHDEINEENFVLKRSNLTSAIDSTIATLIIFSVGNTLYTVISMLLVIAIAIARWRKEIPSYDHNEREHIQLCFDICHPCDSLKIWHHILHRNAFMLNIISICIGADLIFSIPCTILCFIQCILSYLYSEDIVLFGAPCCCFQFWFIRRYPNEKWATVIPINQRFSKRSETRKMTKSEVINDSTLFKPPRYLSTFTAWTEPPPYTYQS